MTVTAAGKGRPSVLVTGASGGVGAGIAQACGRAGWEVWIAARRAPQGQAVADEVTAAGGRGHFIRCDVGRQDDVGDAVAAIVEHSGTLEAVVHNATSSYSPRPHLPQEVPLDELEDHVQVALRALYFLARHCHGPLAASRGSLVVTTSEAGFEGKRLLGAYAAVKAAQRGMARTLAREWGPQGIRVNCVAPLADSPAMVEAFTRDPLMQQRVLGRIPLGHLGNPATDIGNVVRFLLSEDAAFLTGQTIMADGGSCPIT